VIDPNDGMIVMLAHAKKFPFGHLRDWGPVNAHYLTKEPGMAVQDVAAAALLTGRLRFSGRGSDSLVSGSIEDSEPTYQALYPAMGKLHFDRTDYSVVVKNRARPPISWKWEIYRAGRSTRIDQSSVYFHTMATANQAGKEALKQMLDKLFV
jgi:hypothetical protein